MQDITQSIRNLQDETSECGLLGVLAVDEKTRLQNRERAAVNRELLAEAAVVVSSATKGASDEKNP